MEQLEETNLVDTPETSEDMATPEKVPEGLRVVRLMVETFKTLRTTNTLVSGCSKCYGRGHVGRRWNPKVNGYDGMLLCKCVKKTLKEPLVAAMTAAEIDVKEIQKNAKSAKPPTYDSLASSLISAGILYHVE